MQNNYSLVLVSLNDISLNDISVIEIIPNCYSNSVLMSIFSSNSFLVLKIIPISISVLNQILKFITSVLIQVLK